MVAMPPLSSNQMQAYLSHPWCQHRAVEGAPQGESWQKSTRPTGDQLHVLCHWIWSSCNVCWQGHPCPPPRLSTSEEQATEGYPTVPQLHPLTLPWPWQLSHTECHLQQLFQKRPLCTKCCSSGAVGKHAKSDGAVKVPHHQCQEKGQRADIVQVSTKETPLCDELFANTVNCGTAGDTHPKEIVIDNVHAPQCNEAYTMVKLSASISSKETAPLCVQVDTRAGGNAFSLCVCVFPLCVSMSPPRTRWAQLACPLAWITSAPGSPPITDPIHSYMAHSVALLSGGQVALAFNLARSIHTGTLQTHPVLPS